MVHYKDLNLPDDAHILSHGIVANTNSRCLLYRAIEFLQKYRQEYAERVDATHINMLAQLLIEEASYSEALSAMEQAPRAEGGAPYPDIAAKMGVCFVRLGRTDAAAAAWKELLLEPAPVYHDLFVEVPQLPLPQHMPE